MYFELDYCLYLYTELFHNLLYVDFSFGQLAKQYKANILKYLWICPLIPELTDAMKVPILYLIFESLQQEHKVLDSFCLVFQVLALPFLVCWLVSHC